MRILPTPDELSAPYWEAASEHRLVMQHCEECGYAGYPPLPRCPTCHGPLAWKEVSGKGIVHSFTIVHHSVHPVTADSMPYALVAVELDEGPRMLTNLRESSLEDLKVGARVEVLFEDLAEGIGLPQFRLTGEPA